MHLPDLQEFNIPLLLLYAEIHFRFFSVFPSLLFKKEPEVLFDIPHRVKPDSDLHILLIINDLQYFPAVPLEIAITISQQGNGTQLFEFNDSTPYCIDHPLKKNQSAYIFPIAASALPHGEVFVNGKVTLQCGKKKVTVFNDNLPGSTHRALKTFVAEHHLPGSNLCSYGDLHVHSQFSQSHVEFGPPLKVIDRMAASCGLSFIAVTDHSYDLSCATENYLEEDVSLPRWNLLQHALRTPADFSTLLIPGEEISCGNSRNETVHLIGLGHTTFQPGSSDGARKKLKFPKQLSINEVITNITSEKGIAFAAHPGSRSGFLQRMFLHRGSWHQEDITNTLHGIQALNSGFSKAWERGKKLWIEQLQKGCRLPLLAGNDAHGDFSRYRAIKTPFLSIYENFHRYMGYARTGIYGQNTTTDDILHAIKNGTTFITSGPYLSLTATQSPDTQCISSTSARECKGSDEQLYVHAVSTPEFGRVKKITVFQGKVKTRPAPEKQIYSKSFSTYDTDVILPFSFSTLPYGYLRAEVETMTHDGFIHRGYTSAHFIRSNSSTHRPSHSLPDK